MKTGQPRFIVDSMLGSLARKLRLLGIDTAYVRDASDSELKYIVRSEDRILLTADEALAHSLKDRAFLVTGNTLRAQLLSLAGRVPVPEGLPLPFSRCLECNVPLKAIDPAEARGKVPPYVSQSRETFSSCASCGRVFWEGTHRDRMEREVEWMMEMIVRA